MEGESTYSQVFSNDKYRIKLEVYDFTRLKDKNSVKQYLIGRDESKWLEINMIVLSKKFHPNTTFKSKGKQYFYEDRFNNAVRDIQKLLGRRVKLNSDLLRYKSDRWEKYKEKVKDKLNI